MKGRARYVRGVLKGSILTAVMVVVAIAISTLVLPNNMGFAILFFLLIPAVTIAGIYGLISASLFVFIISLLVRNKALDFSNIWAVATGIILALTQVIMVHRFFSIEAAWLWMDPMDASKIIILLLTVSFVGTIVCGMVFGMQYMLRFIWLGVWGY